MNKEIGKYITLESNLMKFDDDESREEMITYLKDELIDIFGEDLYLVNNAIAWVVGVVFAYITNKLFVFESKSWDLKVITKEITGFLGARIFSFLVEEGGMFLFVSVLGLGENSLTLLGFTITGQFIVKILLAVIVVILNYIFSKFIIFKRQ